MSLTPCINLHISLRLTPSCKRCISRSPVLTGLNCQNRCSRPVRRNHIKRHITSRQFVRLFGGTAEVVFFAGANNHSLRDLELSSGFRTADLRNRRVSIIHALDTNIWVCVINIPPRYTAVSCILLKVRVANYVPGRVAGELALVGGGWCAPLAER
jgi:hypothetical protein